MIPPSSTGHRRIRTIHTLILAGIPEWDSLGALPSDGVQRIGAITGEIAIGVTATSTLTTITISTGTTGTIIIDPEAVIDPAKVGPAQEIVLRRCQPEANGDTTQVIAVTLRTEIAGLTTNLVKEIADRVTVPGLARAIDRRNYPLAAIVQARVRAIVLAAALVRQIVRRLVLPGAIVPVEVQVRDHRLVRLAEIM